jgi:hypothetical protein
MREPGFLPAKRMREPGVSLPRWFRARLHRRNASGNPSCIARRCNSAPHSDKTIFPGPIDALRYCQSGCLKGWLIAQFYAPQGTRNLYARLWDAMLEVHNGDPRDKAEASARVSQTFDSAMPLAGGAKETMRRMSYNATGKILVLIALPAYAEYLDIQHDRSALIRTESRCVG